MDGGSSSSSSSSAPSSAAPACAGAARALLRDPLDDQDAMPLVHRYRVSEHQALLLELRRNNQLNALHRAYLENSAAVGEMFIEPFAEALIEGDPADLLLDLPSSSRSVDFDAQSSQRSSWFESSVEDLLRAIKPSPTGGSRSSFESISEGSLGQGSDYKRHKMLGFCTSLYLILVDCEYSSIWETGCFMSFSLLVDLFVVCCFRHSHIILPGTSQTSSSLGGFNRIGQQSDLSALAPVGLENNNIEQGDISRDLCEEGDDNSSVGGMEGDLPSMYLTDDLLHMVFSFLDQKHLCEVAMVCRQWRFASEHEDFWKSLHFRSSITQDQVRNLCRRFPKALHLSFKNVSSVDEVAREAMQSLRYLETLSVYKGNLSDSFFHVLWSGCSSLRHLTIHDAVLGSVGSQEVQVRQNHLKNLQVTECRVMRMTIRCPQLKHLSLRQSNMASAGLHCPELISLDVSSCLKLSDAGVRTAAVSCHNLLALNISYCSYVSDETLREICLACTELRVLDASWCPNISLQGVRMSHLKVLKLNNCEGINSSSMAALAYCVALEAVYLDSCVLLTSVALNLQQLQSISLKDCSKLVDLSLHCPRLVSINVMGCSMLNFIDISSVSLKKLPLQGQQSLATITLDCPNLQIVNLVECESLNNSISEVFSDGGGCPRLNSLTLETCESITKLALSSTTLTTLSLVGCHKLSRIDIACANLQQLFLDGCHQLCVVNLTPVGLQSLNLGICPHVTEFNIEAPEMISVDLKGCGALVKANINCPKLLSLDASYCSELDDICLEAAASACPLIQTLILACCPSIGPAGLLSLEKLYNLTTLDLSYTFLTDLTPIFKSCVRLKVLRLLACKYLVDSALDALHWNETLPELRELDLSYGGLGHTALRGLISHCSHLTHLSLSGCAKLGDLEWNNTPGNAGSPQTNKYLENKLSGCHDNFSTISQHFSESLHSPFMDMEIKGHKLSNHALQQLSCVGCPNVKRVVIHECAGFHDLNSLNLSLSNNLKEAWLECPNLVTLNLSQCTALEQLQLQCPRLVTLSLQASNVDAASLDSVVQGCTALETLDIRNCAKISSEDLTRVRATCPRLKRLLSTVST